MDTHQDGRAMSSIPYATPDLPPDLGFADQRGGMKALGIIMIVIGAFAGCLAAFTPVALLAPRPPGMAGPMLRDVLVGAATYAGASALFVTAGVGSLRGKRWSRPVILILTGTWAAGGVVGLVSWLVVGPDVERAMATMGAAPGGPGAPAGVPGAVPGAPGTPGAAPGVPPVLAGTIRAATVAMLVVFGIALPGGYFWFYVRRNVRQTVEFFDPVPAWTDRCPTPVLALSAWLALTSVFALSFCAWGVYPLFGRLLSGAPALAALVLTSALVAVLAAGAYGVRMWAWWGSLLLLVLYATSSVTTFARVDPLDVYRLSGAPPETIQLMEQMAVNSRSTTIFTTAAYTVAALAYLMWAWRYFRRGQGPAGEPGAGPPGSAGSTI